MRCAWALNNGKCCNKAGTDTAVYGTIRRYIFPYSSVSVRPTPSAAVFHMSGGVCDPP